MLSEFEPEVRRGVVRMLARLADAAARQLGSGEPGGCAVGCNHQEERKP
jgi:hypothetical protein